MKKIGLYEIPDVIEVNGKLYTLQELIEPETEEYPERQDTLKTLNDFMSIDGQMPGDELMASTESNKDIENEDVAGMGFLPNTKFANFKTNKEETFLETLEEISLNLDIPPVESYYNKQGQELDLTKYQAMLNYLVAQEKGLPNSQCLVNAVAARLSLLPKRIRDKNGKLYFPELEHEQRKLYIFSKLNDLFFNGAHYKDGRIIAPPMYTKGRSKKNPNETTYFSVMDGKETELIQKYASFLYHLSNLVGYINDDPNDNELDKDKQANLVEAVDVFSLWVLPSHFILKNHPESKDPHTVLSGIDLLKKFGGSYADVAGTIKKICYDHAK